MHWSFQPTHPVAAKELARALNIHPAVCERLLQIDPEFVDPERAELFLKPRLAQLEDPFSITHLRAAVERIERALNERERILIFGDYDVDGVTSTTLLVHILQRFGAQPDYCIPLRLEEGYGLSRQAIERSFESGAKPDLFIALDCGTNSVDEINYLQSLGIDTLVVDHHQATDAERLPGILVNPHLFDPDGTAWKDLCSVGLTFKVVHGLIKKLRLDGNAIAENIDLRQVLDLVALGTVADLVPLRDENRILASRGLHALYHTKRCGIHALFQVSGIDLSTTDVLRTVDVAFRLGPRINASGRLADACVPVDMLLSEDFSFCAETAGDLDQMNRERQAIERAIAADAILQVEERDPQAAGLVAFDASWHSGVVGIVASRLSRQFHRPAIVLGQDGEGAKGSGRSIEGIDLVAVLEHCDDLLESWGGHPMAVGVSLAAESVPAFRERFAETILKLYPDGIPEQEIELATRIPADVITEQLIEDIEELHPFGQGNPEPTFAVGPLTLQMPPKVFGKGHLRFAFHNSQDERVSCVAWNLSDNPPPVHRPILLAAQLGWNFWNGERTIQATVRDWCFAS